jgi:hypothetical protein
VFLVGGILDGFYWAVAVFTNFLLTLSVVILILFMQRQLL